MSSQSEIMKVGTGAGAFEPAMQDVSSYTISFGRLLTWEADPWYEVCRSWFETSYIHAGISGLECTISGPDAQKLLSYASINNVYKWKIGSCKHLVMCDDNGLITNHALFMRDSEDTFRTTAGMDYAFLSLNDGSYDVQVSTRGVFVFQFSGPKSLTILEKLLKKDLHDVRFLENRTVEIPGLATEPIELCRIGMSGTLAYELRGAEADGPAVYAAAYEAGKPLGLKRLGWRSYPVNHTYGGFPQATCTFESSLFVDEQFQKIALSGLVPTGSVDPADLRARFRTPGEVGWMWMAKFDHDFRGRAAVEAEAADPKRTIVSLEWNHEDIVDIYASMFTDDPYKYMEMPTAQKEPAGGHQDYIRDADGNVVGFSATPIYSSWYRTMISESIIDSELAVEGTELTVDWGDFGGKIKSVRAKVARYPYIDIDRNENYDTSTVEHGENL